MKVKHLFFVSISILILIFAGACSDSDEKEEINEKVKVTDDDGTEYDVEVKAEEGSVEMKAESEDGEEESFSYETKGDLEFPEGFPDDVPLVDDAFLEQKLNMESGKILTYVTNEDEDELWDMYKEYFSEIDSDDIEVDDEAKSMYVYIGDEYILFQISRNLWQDQEGSDWEDYDTHVAFSLYPYEG